MDSRRLAVCLAFGAALSTFSQRRRLAAVLASIGRRLMTGDSMRRLAVRLIDRLMANELPAEQDPSSARSRRAWSSSSGPSQRVVDQTRRERYFDVCGAAVEADGAAVDPFALAPVGAEPPDVIVQGAEPEQPRVITPASAFLYLPNTPHLHVDEDVDPFFGMNPAVFGRSASGALLGRRNPVMSEAGEPPSPRSPCEADLWCWETMWDSD
ncbi:NF-kappaB Inihibitor [Bovine papular stomatitis virus]